MMNLREIDRMLDCKPVVLDIETKTTGTRFQYPNGTESNHPVGLDPRVSSVTSVSFRTEQSLFCIDDDVENVIRMVSEAYIDSLSRSLGHVLFTWNGLFFDLPFLAVRKFGGVEIFTTSDDPQIEPKYGWPEWAEDVTRRKTWNTAMWRGIPHIDIAPYFREYADAKGIRNSLKPVAESFGIPMISVNAEEMDSLTVDERLAYNASDTRGTLQLVQILIDSKGIISA